MERFRWLVSVECDVLTGSKEESRNGGSTTGGLLEVPKISPHAAMVNLKNPSDIALT